jgi:hypothetical protein
MTSRLLVTGWRRLARSPTSWSRGTPSPSRALVGGCGVSRIGGWLWRVAHWCVCGAFFLCQLCGRKRSVRHVRKWSGWLKVFNKDVAHHPDHLHTSLACLAMCACWCWSPHPSAPFPTLSIYSLNTHAHHAVPHTTQSCPRWTAGCSCARGGSSTSLQRAWACRQRRASACAKSLQQRQAAAAATQQQVRRSAECSAAHNRRQHSSALLFARETRVPPTLMLAAPRGSTPQGAAAAAAVWAAA